MEITDKIVLRQPDWTAKEGEMPDRAKVRACTEVAKWKNIAIEQCEDEGDMFVGLHCADSSIEYTEVKEQLLKWLKYDIENKYI